MRLSTVPRSGRSLWRWRMLPPARGARAARWPPGLCNTPLAVPALSPMGSAPCPVGIQSLVPPHLLLPSPRRDRRDNPPDCFRSALARTCLLADASCVHCPHSGRVLCTACPFPAVVPRVRLRTSISPGPPAAACSCHRRTRQCCLVSAGFAPLRLGLLGVLPHAVLMGQFD